MASTKLLPRGRRHCFVTTGDADRSKFMLDLIDRRAKISATSTERTRPMSIQTQERPAAVDASKFRMLHTMVRVMRGGEEVKISKRAGSYVTLRDLIEWTSKDAVRFFLLSRKPDTEYTFDVDLAVTKNNDNPVYYVQYAHARICSVLANAKDPSQAQASLASADLSPLDSAPAQALMMLLAKYPDMLSAAAQDFAPHDVTFYLRELAAAYHSYYDAERILVDDPLVRQARLALVAATAQVLHNGLALLGVSAPTSM